MININKNKCVGCGICANICPEGIEMVAGKARIKDENAECLKRATDACPKKAITFNGEGFNNENINTDYDRNRIAGQGKGFGKGQGRGSGAGMGQGLGNEQRERRGGGHGGRSRIR